jgi:hypothetical protein
VLRFASFRTRLIISFFHDFHFDFRPLIFLIRRRHAHVFIVMPRRRDAAYDSCQRLMPASATPMLRAYSTQLLQLPCRCACCAAASVATKKVEAARKIRRVPLLRRVRAMLALRAAPPRRSYAPF